MMGFIADTEEEKPDVYDKRYTCPVCEQDFTSKTMFARKVRITKYDYDMRSMRLSSARTADMRCMRNISSLCR